MIIASNSSVSAAAPTRIRPSFLIRKSFLMSERDSFVRTNNANTNRLYDPDGLVNGERVDVLKNRIRKIADKYGLKVIYDAAHAFGETWKGRGIGSFGDVSCFSFHATKVYNTIEGGAVCFRDPEFGYTIARLKNFGIRGPEIVDGIGANAKMNEFCAAMGLCNLRHVEQEIERRRAVAEQYREALSGVPGLTLNREQDHVRNNYAYFPVVFDEGVFGADRNRVFDTLLEHGINARKYFYPLTNAMDCYQGRFDPGETPVAQYLADRVLTLPFYPDLDRETVDWICEIILSCRRTY